MRVLSTPASYRASVATLLVFIPLAAFEAYLAARTPWWRISAETLIVPAAVVAVLVLSVGIAIFRGHQVAVSIAGLLASAWVAFTAGLSLRLKHPGLGFFVILLGMSCYGVLAWIRHEMRRSFFNPGLAWYMGLPKEIPGLICEIGPVDQKSRWKVARMDREGAFVFVASAEPTRVEQALSARKGFQELLFRFRDREVKCGGVVMRELIRGTGLGFRFEKMTIDQKKELGDFVEILQGEAYVE